MRKYIHTLKGITIYRDGSKGNSPLVPATEEEVKKNMDSMTAEVLPKDCPSGVCEIS